MNPPRRLAIFGIVVFAAIALVGSLFFTRQQTMRYVSFTPATSVIASSSPSSASGEFDLSSTTDEHLTISNELHNVIFCGKAYQAPQVVFDGIEVVQRIAILANNGATGERICADLSPYYYEPGKLYVSEPNTNRYVDNSGHTKYIICITQECFDIDSVNHDIEIRSAIGGPSAFIGKL